MEIQETGCYISFPYCAYEKLPSFLSINSNTMVLYPFTDRTSFSEIGQGVLTHTQSDDAQ